MALGAGTIAGCGAGQPSQSAGGSTPSGPAAPAALPEGFGELPRLPHQDEEARRHRAQLAELTIVAEAQARRWDDAELSAAIAAVSRGSDPGERAAGSPAGTRRWEFRLLDGHTLGSYARQLDFFGIELGVLNPDNTITYVSGLAGEKPRVRRGPAAEERRCYLSWRSGGLRGADTELLAKAGIDAKDAIILKFIPPAVEKALARLERERAAGRTAGGRPTVFGIRASQGGFEFFVDDRQPQSFTSP